ncbi:broad specificity phosphatase PhoE [Tahibacter aquaticus]|jgi:broad specificity phosphatase PhoE|uniref:Broad specificity phosphatase PhoE n=1 Tax=Tahibacter aquaticus TaxID=520092 RepID=A0A4R6YTU1_9GAMM|nr:histidine phosphatase family protein [Tahibacter aquaticus]TDR41630.1 broad specificity phosphatase PhoE [Tahibacter aquaticus]
MNTFDPAATVFACRHGQSRGNTARAEAEASGLLDVASNCGDADLPLTALGREQAEWLGRKIASLPTAQQPTRILCSPHRRTLETADGIIRHGYANRRIAFSLDRRLTPKAFGVLEGLTRKGVAERFPQLAAERERVGRFHFCPPGGESRCDVVLRVRDFLHDLRRRHAGERVLLVTHQIVINALGYLLMASDQDPLSTNDDGWVPNARLFAFQLGETSTVVEDTAAAA